MTPESQWNGWDGRWRQSQHQDRHADDSRYPPTPTASAVSRASVDTVQTHTPSWGSKPAGDQYQRPQLQSLTRPYSDVSSYPVKSDQRHSPRSGNITATSQHDQQFTSPWHSLPLDHRAQHNQTTPAPLSLKIPDSQGLPRISSDDQFQIGTPISRQQTITSLPSFALFHEHATRGEEPDEVEVAPMSARLPCSLCSKLKPAIYEVAIAVAGLDETAQSHYGKATTRAFNVPADDPVRALQWILERVAKSKSDLQDASRSTYYYHGPQYPDPSSMASEQAPMNPLKRPGVDEGNLPASKRRRSIMSPEDSSRATSGFMPINERKGSVDLAAGGTPPLETMPSSAHPKSGSPPLLTRPQRNLPSPSSLAYPLSAAPSVVPQATQYMGSPATSYQPTVSIHSSSNSSATSAHIADLQHQVTLKTLSLSTLQSEYSSLLQKVQRERVKSQAIEKKTSVADQEVNDLTGRNEELIDQVKSLEAQLEASEKKRDSERAEVAREKEQWARMLELGGRIQTKTAEEKQKLREEVHSLAQRVAGYGADLPGGGASAQPYDASRMPPVVQTADRTSEGSQQQPAQTLDMYYTGSQSAPASDLASLIRQNEALHSRIENLRFALEEARRQHQLMNERTREVLTRSEQLGSVVQRALEDEDHRRAAGSYPYSLESTTFATLPAAPGTQKQLQAPSSIAWHPQDFSLPSSAADSRKVSQTTDTSTATLASIARAVSPGPAELGFHVTPTTSSPEDIVRALGPAPAPHPGNQTFPAPFQPLPPVAKPARKQSTSRQPKPPRRQSTDAVSSWLMPRTADQLQSRDTFQIGAFRPLSQPCPPGNDISRLTEQGRLSPHSHHSSPGPVRDERSPSSAGSVEAKVQLPSINAIEHEQAIRRSEQSSVMPPPPRPAVVTESFAAAQ